MWAEEEEHHQQDIATRPMENISSPSLPPAPCSCSSLSPYSSSFLFFCLMGVCRGASCSTILAQERPTTPKQHNPTTKSFQKQQPKICFSQKTTENLQPNLFQDFKNTETNTTKNQFRKHSKHTHTHTHKRTKICFSQKTHTQMSPIKTTTQNPVLSENKENQPTLSQKSHTHTHTQNKICFSVKTHDNKQNLSKTHNQQQQKKKLSSLSFSHSQKSQQNLFF
jgi:hypothetical protein